MKPLPPYLIIIIFLLQSSIIGFSGGLKYENETGQYLKLGGRIQIQYHRTDSDEEDSKDELTFRRLRPYIEGSLHEYWKAKFQWDMGKSNFKVKDAYFQYSGIEGMKISFGNKVFPFSRELLTSSKKQQTVERSFVGDHNYGTPDRQVGLHLEGHVKGNKEKTMTWGAGLAMGAIDPSNKKLDFDTLANKNDDFSEGPMIGARVDFHHFGKMKFSQGDFERELKTTIGIAVFAWQNDEDNLSSTLEKDVDRVNGFEISGALRGSGVSVDIEYNIFDAELVKSGISSGLYKDSETTLKNFSIEGGYMVIPDVLEPVFSYQFQDADGYEANWERIEFGVNYFVKKHDIKFQFTYRINGDKDGVKGQDVDELFLQTQYVF